MAARRFDLRGLLLGSAGLLGIVYGLVQSQTLGWIDTQILFSLIVGWLLLIAFVAYEMRIPERMLPVSFFAKRAFAVTHVVSLAMYFGMFGSIFLLSQFLLDVRHDTPLQAGVKLLVWPGATMVVLPLAGFFSERYGARLYMAAGLSLQAIALGRTGLGDSDLLQHDRPIHPRRNRFCARVRTRCQRCGLLGPGIRDGAGIGRHQRDPRARRSSRHRGALHRVHQPRQLRLAAQAFVSGHAPAMWAGVGVLAAGALIAAVLPFDSQREMTAQSPQDSAEGAEIAEGLEVANEVA